MVHMQALKGTLGLGSLRTLADGLLGPAPQVCWKQCTRLSDLLAVSGLGFRLRVCNENRPSTADGVEAVRFLLKR